MKPRHKILPFALLLTVLIFYPFQAFPWAQDPVNTNWWGVAIKGYDTVAYFTQGKPVKGSKKFEYYWNGATWRFANAKDLALFKANPEKYAPQYGGYCAYAVAWGDTADIDPNAWKIVDGKLYLNYDKATQKKWEQDIPGYIDRANLNWPGVLK